MANWVYNKCSLILTPGTPEVEVAKCGMLEKELQKTGDGLSKAALDANGAPYPGPAWPQTSYLESLKKEMHYDGNRALISTAKQNWTKNQIPI